MPDNPSSPIVSYQSPNTRPTWWARRFPSATFYSKAFYVVVDAAAKTKTGRGGHQTLMESSVDILHAIESLGIKVTVENVDVLRSFDGPCIIVANHMSTLETFVLPGIVLPIKPMTFVLKRSLVDYPIFGIVARSWIPIVVGRVNPREDLRAMLEGGHDRITRGISVTIFPQTTRTPVFRPDQFNSIGVKLAKREGVPIVPVALQTDAWGTGKYLKDFGPVDPAREVRFCFGDPIHVTNNDKEAHQQIVDFIASKLDEWKQCRAQSAE